ncbi:phospholipase A and acyltransferase 3-like isoform 2-T2 [Leptodactylus fuscus]|uniref:phospholipase A and acyltransferase 3-like isoform X2 n=1 Tax=Leptodactylus fuscus TaxID=238119 RepID=UPI003F4F1D30
MPLKGSYPEPGDLVEFYRGVYQHWGVYVGDGKVVHLTTGLLGSSGSSCSSSSSLPGVGKGMVKEESLETVAGEDTYRVNNKYDEKRNPRPADEIVKAAREEVGKKKKYAVTCANCEHFVTELRYGSSYSDQGRTAKSVIRYGERT